MKYEFEITVYMNARSLVTGDMRCGKIRMARIPGVGCVGAYVCARVRVYALCLASPSPRAHFIAEAALPHMCLHSGVFFQ